MRQIVADDVPFVKESLTKDEAIARFMDMGCPEKIELLNENPEMRKIPFYSLAGYRDFFYGQMVPSAGYIKYFELRKYRRGVLLRFPQISSPDKIPGIRRRENAVQDFRRAKSLGKAHGHNLCFRFEQKDRRR